GDAKHTWAELQGKTGSRVEPAFELSDTPAPTQRERPKFSNDFDSEPDLVPADDIVITVLNELPEAMHAHTSEQRPAPEVLPWAGETTFISATPAPSSAHASEPRNGNSLDSFDGFTVARAGLERGKILCPFHEEKTPSCQLYDDGHYFCFGCRAHGWIAEDMVDLPAAVLAQAAKADDGQTLERGLALWNDGKPIIGTLAERYLVEARKLDLTVLPSNIDEVLR